MVWKDGAPLVLATHRHMELREVHKLMARCMLGVHNLYNYQVKLSLSNHIINDVEKQKVHLPALGGGGGSARIGGSRGRFGLCCDEEEGGILG